MVSGTMVGGKKYFDGMADVYTNFSGDFPEVTQTFGNNLSEIGKISYGVLDEINSQNSVTSPFIHLRGAKFFHTSGISLPNNADIWWRGRISEVGGSFLGKIE